MPLDVVRATGHSRQRSLGWLAVAWMEYFALHGPGDVQGERVRHTDEQTVFIADCYALDPTGRRLYDSGFLSRPKGCDKSGLGARFSLFEAFGPCRFAGWARGGEVYRDPWGLGFIYRYKTGEPMGRPVRVPYIRCMATEEGQTGHVYDAILFNLTDEEVPAPLARVPGVRAGLLGTYLPGGGEITPSTASSAAKDGGKETFVDFDESHLYNTPELRRMYRTVTRNMRKRKRNAETWALETTTMFAPGEDSIAELTYKLAEHIREGRTRRERLLFDHRYGICDDLSDEMALRAAITDAYGESLAWNDIDGLVDGFYDPREEVTNSRRYFLNAPTGTFDSWLAHPEWAGCADAAKVVGQGEPVTLGFDGSRARSHSVTDATALIGCRVSDGHLFEIGVWEQPEGPAGDGWTVPVVEVEAALHAAFARYRVVGCFADPAKWESYIAAWEARYHRQLRVKATRDHPMQWWMTGGRSALIVRALEQFHSAIVDGELTHDGSYALSRHVLNARRRPSRSGMQIGKEHPESPRKIDAAVAAVLAWQARLAAVAMGVGAESFVPRRVR
jgi:hypothetical protein